MLNYEDICIVIDFILGTAGIYTLLELESKKVYWQNNKKVAVLKCTWIITSLKMSAFRFNVHYTVIVYILICKIKLSKSSLQLPRNTYEYKSWYF